MQAKRHLWGSLDTGYAMRRTLLAYVCPEEHRTLSLKNVRVNKLGKEELKDAFSLYTIGTLFHRLLEAHVLMGQLFMMITVGSLIFPVGSSVSYDWAAWMWSYVSGSALPEEVVIAVDICFFIRLLTILPNLAMIFLYEKYLQWVGFERWALQENMLSEEKNIYAYPKSDNYLGDLKRTYKSHFTCKAHNAHLKVQHLGKRASLASPRNHPYCLLDWVCIPISGLLFYVIPQWVSQITHLWTNKLDYQVAAKPQLANVCFSEINDGLIGVLDDVKSVGSKDEGFFEEDESPSLSRSSSGGIGEIIVEG